MKQFFKKLNEKSLLVSLVVFILGWIFFIPAMVFIASHNALGIRIFVPLTLVCLMVSGIHFHFNRRYRPLQKFNLRKEAKDKYKDDAQLIQDELDKGKDHEQK